MQREKEATKKGAAVSPRTRAPVRHTSSPRHTRGGPWGGGVAGATEGSAAESLRDNIVYSLGGCGPEEVG